MIRHAHGDSFLLIKQHDHALLSGKFAQAVGNAQFAPPCPFQETVDAVALHDCGWPIHDDDVQGGESGPTLNKKGQPLHVLESPMDLATRVWSESAKRATAADKSPYTALLVSLHVTALSSLAQSQWPGIPHERARTPAEQFMLNKFQQQQFEHQEDLRKRLKMRTDLPLTNGLADLGVDDAEDLLLFNYGLLKAMDRLSLDLCCSEDLFKELDDVYPRPGDSPITIKVRHTGRGAMELSPWPFAVERLDFDVPCRRVPARTYESTEAFRDVYRAAPLESYRVRVAAF
jgi:hypothetical protein